MKKPSLLFVGLGTPRKITFEAKLLEFPEYLHVSLMYTMCTMHGELLIYTCKTLVKIWEGITNLLALPKGTLYRTFASSLDVRL